MSSDKYVKYAVTDVKLELTQNDQSLQMNVHTPLSNGLLSLEELTSLCL